mmetsp:Transcript_87178/g.260056  ORF Transcript_87178/g.260056 Transcript_87178/m.260056 type:complete len:215 (+) Transcript_87178:55-699(+)
MAHPPPHSFDMAPEERCVPRSMNRGSSGFVCFARARTSSPSRASISFRTSGVILSTKASAPNCSSTCSGAVAPVITVETSGFAMHQARASCAMLHPSRSAMGRRRSACSAFFRKTLKSGRFLKSSLARRELPGTSPLPYLPVRTPLASGDQIVRPSPMPPYSERRYSGLYSDSTRPRASSEYSGWSAHGGTRPRRSATALACRSCAADHSEVAQ